MVENIDDDPAGEALAVYLEQIETALRWDEIEPAKSRLISDQRAYAIACMATWSLLAKLGRLDLAHRFQLLGEAFVGLSDGYPQPLFRVDENARKSGRHPDAGTVWRLRARICSGIIYMVEGAVQQDEAIKWIVRNHADPLSNIIRTSTSLESSIAGWMKQFEMLEVTDPVAALAYKVGKKLAANERQKLPGVDLKKKGEAMIDAAANEASYILKTNP